jgi:hypothetical protein
MWCFVICFEFALLLWLLWQGYGISTQGVKKQRRKDANREWHGKPHPFVVAPSLRSLLHCMLVNTCLRAYMSECLPVGLNVCAWCIYIKHRHSARQTCIYDICLPWRNVCVPPDSYACEHESTKNFMWKYLNERLIQIFQSTRINAHATQCTENR